MKTREYDGVRTIIENLGGSMKWVRKGYRFGAWEIKLNGKSKVVPATGKRSFPELDELYKPRIEKPTTYDDYTNELIPEAQSKVLSWFKS